MTLTLVAWMGRGALKGHYNTRFCRKRFNIFVRKFTAIRTQLVLIRFIVDHPTSVMIFFNGRCVNLVQLVDKIFRFSQ